MASEEFPGYVCHFGQLAKPEVVFAGDDAAFRLGYCSHQPINGQEGIRVSADDELWRGNRLPAFRGDAGCHGRYGYEGYGARGAGGEAYDDFGTEGVAGEGDVFGVYAISVGQEGYGGFQVFEFAGTIIVRTFAAAHATEVEPEGWYPELGEFLGKGHYHAVVHIAAIEGVGMGYDNGRMNTGFSLGWQGKDALEGERAGWEGDSCAVHAAFLSVRLET